MPMSQSLEMSHQRKSPRVPLRPKPAAFSDANSLSRATVDRRTKMEDRRPSRNVLQEKKRRERVTDLETKLNETMVELKMLKEQLELEEAAKRVVLKKLEKTKKVVAVSRSRNTFSSPEDVEEEKEKLVPVEKDVDSCITTDTCEVSACCTEENDSRAKSEVIIEMAEIRAKLEEKEKELEAVKKEAEQAMASSYLERKKNEEMETKLAGTEDELKLSRAMLEQMKQKIETQEGEKEAMEDEMKRLRIQTDQWRKASEAAASILDDESFKAVHKPLETYGEGWPPVTADANADEGLPGQKRRGGGGGMRVLGELWKKRGQQK